MTIALTGTNGLFTRLGHFFGALSDVIALQGGTATARVLSGASMATRGTTLETDAAYSPSVSPELDGHWTAISSWRSAQASIFSSFNSLAQKEFVRQVDLDASLASRDLTSALKELVRQMTANGTSVNASSVSLGAQTDVGTPTGNVKIVTTSKAPSGLIWQTIYAETLRFTCTSDAQTGGATARNETLSVTGAPAVDPTSYLWPGGSGCNVSVQVTDAQKNNSAGNLLQNMAFETSSNTNSFDNVIFRVGVAGTDYFANGSGYTLTNALKLTGDGSTLLAFYQPFGATLSTTAGSGGTTATLKPSTTYAVNFFVKAVSAAPLAGVLRVALVDGSNVVINDDQGTANSFTVDLTATTTSYVAYNGVFRTPSVLPSSGQRLEFKTTTAITNTSSVVLDDVAMTAMTSLYAGGPSVAAFAASTNAIKGDQWTSAVTNTVGVFASWLERLFQLNSKGLIVPYDSGSPTVGDALVA